MAQVHTHTGTCQFCGRVQAVEPKTGLLAKHGYKVVWSSFQGTCQGSDEYPLERDRTGCDGYRARLSKWAAANRAEAAAYKSGEKLPEMVLTHNLISDAKGRSVREAVPFAQGHEYQQREAVERVVRQLSSKARDMEAHEQSLAAMADERHGKPLYPRVEKQRATIGTEFQYHGHTYKVVKFDVKATWRGTNSVAKCSRPNHGSLVTFSVATITRILNKAAGL